MPLFRDENPALGPTTVVKELSGFGSGNPVVNYFKPTTREIVSWSQNVSGNAYTSGSGQYMFIAPWQCKVLSIKATFTTAGTGASQALNVNKVPQAGLPIAPGTASNGTTVIAVTSAAGISLLGTANTTISDPLSVAGGTTLTLQPGDQLCVQFSGTVTTAAVGLFVQVELQQIG